MIKDYSKIAKETRIEVLGMIHRGQTSHIASCFSAVDLAVVLYENVDFKKDIVCWSKGWSAALIYSLLARHGFIPKKDLLKFPNPPYLGLAEPSVNGVYGAGGAMGHLLPIAVGMALAKKRAGEKGTIYCIMSDGEWQEGTTWESAMIGGQNKLNNLVVITDYNKWTAMGPTKDVADIEPIAEKWRGFKWEVLRIDGHNYSEIEWAINTPNKLPLMIVADTIKGKGVKEFENKILYHYANIDVPTFKMAMKELNA